MHRSGTSCLAGSLEEAGLSLGEVNTVAAHNIKGTRERTQIWELHDAVLRHNGGSWSQPSERVSWSDEHRAERDAIIRSHADTPAWGFKDPRTLLLLEFWREAVPNLILAGTFREPRFVAESLYRREGRQVDYWLDLWAHYNTRLLALHEAAAFPIVRFDLAEAAYRRSLAIVIDSLELRAPAQMEFFDPKLRHHVASPPRLLPEKVCRLYQALCSIALDPQVGSEVSLGPDYQEETNLSPRPVLPSRGELKALPGTVGPSR
jgi:hypothetical protein